MNNINQKIASKRSQYSVSPLIEPTSNSTALVVTSEELPEIRTIIVENDGSSPDMSDTPLPKADPDTDGDHVKDKDDLDDDNDGIPDLNETSPTDTDGDGLEDRHDLDSDNDGIPDVVEAGATDVDVQHMTIGNFVDDSSKNGLSDNLDTDPLPIPDTDNDGTPDFRDNDSDNDTIPDKAEAGPDPIHPLDTDDDGVPDYIDPDSDDDGASDEVEAGSDPGNPVDTDGDGVPDYRDTDSDNDGLNDTREGWWLCSRTDPDTNGDQINDSASINPDNPDRTYPYRSEDISSDNDVDGDGLPDAAEMNEVGTDFKIFSTDGDPYGDGQEYFHINMPEIPVVDSPFVAAYPALSVKLNAIKVTPIGEITSTTGGSKQTAWSLTTETSKTEMNSYEEGAEIKFSHELKGKWTGPEATTTVEIGAHLTFVQERSHTTTNSKTDSGFTQKDWSTAVTTRPNEAAKLALTMSVMNSGTAPAEAIIPNVNIKLGKKEIATITSPTTIASLDIGETSARFVVDQGLVGCNGEDIIVSLDQLKAIDIGTPLSIEGFEINAKAKRWDDESGEWVCVGEDFATYMREIDERCATLVFELEGGVYKEYKVYASSSTTIGDALNWTINIDKSVPLQNSTNWSMGFYPRDAYNELLKMGTNLTDMELKPGWTIIMTLPKGGGPVIQSPVYGEDMRSVKAIVYDNNFTIKSVVANVTIGDSLVELEMFDDDNNTIYEAVVSDGVIERKKGAYINATNSNDISSKMLIETMPAELKPPLEDGWYIISAKDSFMCLEGQTGGAFNVIQNIGHGYLNQRWYLENLGFGRYCIRNSDTINYCPADVEERYCNGDNVTSSGFLLLEVDRGRESAGANVQLKEIRQETDSLEGDYQYLEYANDTHRQFYFDFVGSEDGFGCYRIGAEHSEKYLTVDGGSDESGASIIQENYTEADHQKWIVQPVDSYPSFLLEDREHLLLEPYKIVAGHSYMAMGISYEEGEIVAAQRLLNNGSTWIFEPVGNGYFEIRCADADYMYWYLTSDGNSVFLNSSPCGDNQKWRFKESGDGYYQIISKSNDNCLTVEDNNITNGCVVSTNDYRGYSYQRWKLLSAEELGNDDIGLAYLYKYTNYQGMPMVLEWDQINDGIFNDLGEFTNKVNSLKISRGWALVIYEDKNLTGRNVIYLK